MYRLIISITCLLFSCNNNQKNMKDTSINIIPKPTSIKKSSQYFDLNSIKGINIENNSKYEKYIAGLFKNYLKPLKDLEIEQTINDPKNRINISLNAKHSLGREEYKLHISDLGFITIEASHEPGLFYGFQSFRQLCDPEFRKRVKTKNIFYPFLRN